MNLLASLLGLRDVYILYCTAIWSWLGEHDGIFQCPESRASAAHLGEKEDQTAPSSVCFYFRMKHKRTLNDTNQNMISPSP